jgi:mRNA interferase MazF
VTRGDVWTVAGGGAYRGKPRPAVVLQDDRFAATNSVIVCPVTSDPADAPLFRIPVTANDKNGLQQPCRLMVDKLTAVPRARLRRKIGTLGVAEMTALDRAVAVFLGLGG